MNVEDIKYEFLFMSPRGMEWIPCEHLYTHRFQLEMDIRYFSPIMQDYVTETVDAELVRNNVEELRKQNDSTQSN